MESWNKEHFAWLTGILRDINSYGNFNCIFSDGEHLFCYHDSSGYRGLNFLHRESPYGYIQLIDDDWEGELSEEKKPGEKGFIIATSRLTNEKWQKFKPGELMVFSEGRLVYSSAQV